MGSNPHSRRGSTVAGDYARSISAPQMPRDSRAIVEKGTVRPRSNLRLRIRRSGGENREGGASLLALDQTRAALIGDSAPVERLPADIDGATLEQHGARSTAHSAPAAA